MKASRITSIAILSVLLGIAAPGFAQQEQHSEKQDHPDQQQSKHQQAKPTAGHAQQPRQSNQKQQQAQQKQQQDQNKQQQQAQQKQRRDQNNQQRAQQQRQQDQNKQQQRAQQQQRQDQNKELARQQRSNEQPQRAHQQQRVEQSAWQQHRARNWQSDHRTWQQRGGYHGYRIPDDRFRGYFGPSHGFRIYGLPFMVVGGYPRFRYQGYWISLVDPWPEYWGNDWYDNDDVYVAYVDNGYYLYNNRCPNVGIAVNISF